MFQQIIVIKSVKEKFEQIQLIENSKNYGYCEGNNIGIRKSNGEFIVILNPDTIVEPNWLDEFLIASFKIWRRSLSTKDSCHFMIGKYYKVQVI